MSKITEVVKAWVDGTLGGSGADLGAVDEDIVVLNSHQIDLRGDDGTDPILHSQVYFNADSWATDIKSSVENGVTDVNVVDPESDTTYVQLHAAAGEVIVTMRVAGEASNFSLAGQQMIETFDVLHQAGTGPILRSPDQTQYRLIVANDGTLSTEPVV